MAGADKLAFQPDYAIAPGESLRELIETLGMSHKEMATRLEMTEQSLVRILKGTQPITYDTSERLEMVTGTPASFWNNLEALYREQLAKVARHERLAADIDWLNNIPLPVLRERGFLSKSRDKTEQLKEVLHFFGVSSVAAWRDIWETPAVAARRSACFESRTGHAAVWIRMGELQAAQIACAPYEKTRFREALARIRRLTRRSPGVFVEEMKRLCAEAGVALALVPEIPKVPWNGATKWLTPTKAMILLNMQSETFMPARVHSPQLGVSQAPLPAAGLVSESNEIILPYGDSPWLAAGSFNLRGKKEDIFWFSFFHEAGHVLNDGKKGLYINDGTRADDREKQADAFAAEILIPAAHNNRIKAMRSRNELLAVAEELDISPGIVAGRFQFLTKKWDWFKDEISGLV